MNNKNRFEVNLCRFINTQNNELYGKAMSLYINYAEGLIEFKSPVHTLEQHLENILWEVIDLTSRGFTSKDCPKYQEELKSAIRLLDAELQEGRKQLTQKQ